MLGKLKILSRLLRKPDFFICKNKDIGQLRGNYTADQHICFGFLDTAIPVLPKPEISKL